MASKEESVKASGLTAMHILPKNHMVRGSIFWHEDRFEFIVFIEFTSDVRKVVSPSTWPKGV